MKNVWKRLPLFFAAALIFTACDDEDQQVVDLPATIQAYVDANYAGAEIEESEQDTLCDGTPVYEVEVEINDDEDIELTFDNEGNLLFTESDIATADLPAAVTSSINANYAGYTTDDAEALAMADGSTRYEVELESGNTTLEVLFAADGTVICEEVDDED